MSIPSDIVRISNKTYSIKQSPFDRARRREYFITYKEGSENKLTNDESNLLIDLGIDSKLMNQLRLYLPSFFDTIHACNTDASLILKKSCSISHYVLWSILFANKIKSDERVLKNKEVHSSLSNHVTALNSSMIQQMARRKYTDEYDDIFELILMPKRHDVGFRNNLLQFPSILPPVVGTHENDDENEHGVNIEYAADINPIFQLIVINPSASHGKSFTFTQKGNTCGTDALFTILLQADDLRTIFDVHHGDATPELRTLEFARQRMKTMKELELKELQNTGRLRRHSLNEGHAKRIREDIGSCLKEGVTTSEIFKYVKNVIDTIHAPVDIYYGYDQTLYRKNKNKIKGIYVSGTGSGDTKLGHAIGFLKINNEWYISDNEVGYLHKFKDTTFINTLLDTIVDKRNVPGDVMFTFTEFKSEDSDKYLTDDDLLYQFETGPYVYPNKEITQLVANVYSVKVERMLVFTMD